MKTMKNAAIMTTVENLFNHYNASSFAKECSVFVTNDCGLQTGEENTHSWENCFDFLKENLGVNTWGNFPILFEYMMPESQKRADVIILGERNVLILEFKMKNGKILEKDIRQAGGYQNSIQHYHKVTADRHMKVSAFLTYTLDRPAKTTAEFPTLWKENFAKEVAKVFYNDVPLPMEDAEEWLNSPLEVLKNMLESALQLFETGEFPQIKSIQEGQIKENLDALKEIIDTKAGKKIAFVTGVPGAGKTLIGLKVVFDYLHNNIGEGKANPVFVSGNGPLVNILQNLLPGAPIFLMRDFKKYAYNNVTPNNKIIIFDEAQRAWDSEKQDPNVTEPKLLLRIGEKIRSKHGKVTVVCLIGSGQAIHIHEESGMAIWRDALLENKDWDVFISPKNKEDFSGVESTELAPLYLDVSIRNDFLNISPWIEAILAADLTVAKKEYSKLRARGFAFYVATSLDKLQQVRNVIVNNHPKDYTGLLVSSHLRFSLNWGENKAGEKSIFGADYNGSYVKDAEAYQWLTTESKTLRRAGSEFLMQGIEIDRPIVAFAGDYYIRNGKWEIDSRANFNSQIVDRQKIMENTYRVLLSRSRKGMALYIPDIPQMQETIKWFYEMKKLDVE